MKYIPFFALCECTVEVAQPVPTDPLYLLKEGMKPTFVELAGIDSGTDYRDSWAKSAETNVAGESSELPKGNTRVIFVNSKMRQRGDRSSPIEPAFLEEYKTVAGP